MMTHENPFPEPPLSLFPELHPPVEPRRLAPTTITDAVAVRSIFIGRVYHSHKCLYRHSSGFARREKAPDRGDHARLAQGASPGRAR